MARCAAWSWCSGAAFGPSPERSRAAAVAGLSVVGCCCSWSHNSRWRRSALGGRGESSVCVSSRGAGSRGWPDLRCLSVSITQVRRVPGVRIACGRCRLVSVSRLVVFCFCFIPALVDPAPGFFLWRSLSWVGFILLTLEVVGSCWICCLRPLAAGPGRRCLRPASSVGAAAGSG